LFSGLGAFEKALANIGIKFDVVGYSEIDKYAAKAYSLLHSVSEDLNIGDIVNVDELQLPDFDLMTYGFPCQDISTAGRQQGFKEGSETRSSLLWEAMRVARHKKPKFMIAENVKNLIGKKFEEDFDKWIQELNELGYRTYYKVLNAKNFGIPHNRERVFIVSVRKDVDMNFDFPCGIELARR
jgi:DNA (cytosine-5)-methyltransferase 1